MDCRDQLYIGGEWVDAASSERLRVVSPATEQLVGEVPLTTVADADAAVRAAREAFDHGPWPRLSPRRRAEHLLALRDALRPRIEAVALTISLETGSPLSYSRRMQTAVLNMLEFYAAQVDVIEGIEERPGRGTQVRILREPVGVAALILPWNGPFGTLITKLAPALLSGCTVVIKPAPETPLDAYPVADAVNEAGIPPGVVNIVHGDGAVGGHLASHPLVDAISVTGSVTTGQRVLARAAEGIKRVTLELGGKSPCIILPDAPLEAAAACAIRAGMMNAGQVCVAWSRVFVPRGSYDDVVERLAARAASRRLRDPLDPDAQMGPLTTSAQRDKVEGFVAGAVEQGATIATGGRRPAEFERGWWYEPTILRDVTNDMRVAREEIFGPVMSVIPYDTVDDAVAFANDSDYGLSAGVWGGDLDAAWSVACQLRTGTVCINGFSIEDEAPFGGYKKSGLGREWGPEGLDAFTELKTISLPPAAGQDAPRQSLARACRGGSPEGLP